MSKELLYTQEDINEWMRACYELQVRLRELDDAIKVKDMLIEQLENQNDRLIEQRDAQEQQLANYKGALKLACKDRCHRCYSMITGTCQYDPKTYDCKSEQMFLDQVKKELEEQK